MSPAPRRLHSLLLTLILLLLPAAAALAHVQPAESPPADMSGGVYLNPTTGRFWTMDSYGGDKEVPMSLHKYLYCGANPANSVDPSGHDGTITAIGQLAVTGLQYNSRTLEGSAAAAAQASMMDSLVFKIGAWAITGTAVAGNVAMVLDALGPTPQQQHLEKFKYKPYFGQSGTCVRYAELFKENNRVAAYVGFRLMDYVPSTGITDRILPKSGVLFDQDKPASLNGFHVGALLNNLVFDNNLVGVPLPLWGEEGLVHGPGGGMMTVNQAVRDGWMEMRVFRNSGPPHTRWNLPNVTPPMQWETGEVLPPY